MRINPDEKTHNVPTEPVAVFPLAHTVLFPHIEMPLHIIEDRYRSMLKDVFSSSNYIAISCIKKGHESAQDPIPTHDIVGVGYLKLSMDHDDGSTDILLKGIYCAKIHSYLQTHPYRIARLEVLHTECTDEEAASKKVKQLHRLLLQKLIHAENPDTENIHRIESLKDPDAISGIAAYTAHIDTSIKQELLETLDLNIRLDRLIKILEAEILLLKGHS
ncbi:MAG: LON peptidase substrate-binding domain-containing protein [Chlamydiota bacterium]|nr:LON peptidase substrate-binding domain-containing protein [Chlamydiota bacterium]